MNATMRNRGVARLTAVAVGVMTLLALAVPMDSARAGLTLVDFGVTSLPPSPTSVRFSAPYARSVLVWPGAARLPVVMP
jgi:hypothetical protein